MRSQFRLIDEDVGEIEQILDAHALWTAIHEDIAPSSLGAVSPSLASERNVDGRNALMWALYLGRWEWAKALREVCSWEDTDNMGRTALMWAADSVSDLDKTWIHYRPTLLFAVDAHGDDAISIAAKRGNAYCAFWLLMAHGVKDFWRVKPEAVAAAFAAEPVLVVRFFGMNLPHADTIRRQIEALSVDSDVGWRGTPLHLAAAMGMLAVVDRLLQEGANPHALGESSRTPLMASAMAAPSAVRSQERVALAKRLLSVSDPLWQDDEGRTALMFAAKGCDADMVRLLLPVSDPNARANFEPWDAFRTAQNVADGRGRECADILDSARRKFTRYPHANDPRGNRFRAAARSGSLSTLSAMIKTEKARMALDENFLGENEDPAPLSHRLDPHHQDALMLAARYNQPECVAFLIETSDPFARDNGRASALMIAAKYGRLECVRLLVSVSSRDARDQKGNTALMIAVACGNVEVARFLLPICRSDLVNHARENLKALAVRSGSAETIAIVESSEKAS